MAAPAPVSLFISDLHLTVERPAAYTRFFRFLNETVAHASELYILGDFFEAWVGDDALAHPFHAEVAAALRSLSVLGVRVSVMHGNRDFLLAEDFCRASGAGLLPEPSVADLYGEPTVLMHGDALCTDDVDYQRFRHMVRDPAWQAAFLRHPLAEREAMARELRNRSEQSKGDKRQEIMDVNATAVETVFRQYGVRRLIHGHTHRPARHSVMVDGVACERWVLPDWYETGGYLACDATGCRLVMLD